VGHLSAAIQGHATCENSYRSIAYGTFFASWDHTGSNSKNRLRDHLDPIGSAPLVWDGLRALSFTGYENGGGWRYTLMEWTYFYQGSLAWHPDLGFMNWNGNLWIYLHDDTKWYWTDVDVFP